MSKNSESAEKTFINVRLVDMQPITVPSCPFCGSGNVDLSNTWTPVYSVVCQECGAEGPTASVAWGPEDVYDAAKHYEVAKAAVSLWSARP